MKEVIDKLRFYESRTFPREFLKEAIAHEEETTKWLLKEFDEFLEQPEIVLNDSDYILHLYAIYLLAQFRVKEAFPKIIELVSWPAETIDFTLGDVVTEDLKSILYSTFNGEIHRLIELIEDTSIAFYVRDAALNTYTQLYIDGIIEEDAFYAYIRNLMADERFVGHDDVAEMIQGVVMDFHLFELLNDIQALYDSNRIDTQIAGEYDEFLDHVYLYYGTKEPVRYIEDTIRELERWGMFDPSEELKIELKKRQAILEKELVKLESRDKSEPKVERNDPCPCGSGKKHKKCCLRKDSVYRQKNQESQAVQQKWLEYYPKENGPRVAGEVRITDHYDDQAIAIDKLAYLALHHRPKLMGESQNPDKEIITKLGYLSEALELFIKKCEVESIDSFEDYDNLHKIHYRSKDWVSEIRYLIVRNDLEFEYEGLLEKTEEVMKDMG